MDERMVERSGGRAEVAREVAVAAAVAAGGLYWLIGLGMLDVGRPADRSSGDLFGFGAVAGTTFLVVAALLWRVRSRVLWVVVAALQVLVIGGYFAMGGIREPSFELWGLLIKGCQAIVLVAVAWLVVRPADAPASPALRS